MKHLKDLKTPLNKAINSVRLLSILVLIVSLTGLVPYTPEGEQYWGIYTLALSGLATSSLSAILVCELFWKIMLKNSDVTHRKFYFYDEE